MIQRIIDAIRRKIVLRRYLSRLEYASCNHLTKKQAKIAANWWVSKLHAHVVWSVVYDTPDYHNKIDAFGRKVQAYILKERPLLLWVDYEAMDDLSQIAQRCGIRLNHFPIKTRMKLEEGVIVYSDFEPRKTVLS